MNLKKPLFRLLAPSAPGESSRFSWEAPGFIWNPCFWNINWRRCRKILPFATNFPLSSMAELSERLKKIKPDLHNTTDLTDRGRLIRAIEIAEFSLKIPAPRVDPPGLKPAVFGIKWDRLILRRRITQRLRERLNGGMVAEVKDLHQAGLSFDHLDFYGLEYRYAALHLKGELNRNDLFQKLNSAIHQFAKRQETWFRRLERKGIKIHWVEGNREPAEAILKIVSDSAQVP